MTFLSHSLYDMPGRAPHMDVLFWGQRDFPITFSNRDTPRTLEVVIEEVLWSIRGSHQTIWSSPLTSVKCHSVAWTNTMAPTSDQTLHQIMTWIPNLTFYRITWGFHTWFATGVACRQETLNPPDTWSRLIWDLQMFYLWRPVLFPNLWFVRI